MEKDKASADKPVSQADDAIDYSRHMRLLRLAESLGLQVETLRHIKASMIEGETGTPLKIRGDSTIRQAASLLRRESFASDELTDATDARTQAHPLTIPPRESEAFAKPSSLSRGSVSIPVREFEAADFQNFLDEEKTQLDSLPQRREPAVGYAHIDPLSLSLPQAHPDKALGQVKRERTLAVNSAVTTLEDLKRTSSDRIDSTGSDRKEQPSSPSASKSNTGRMDLAMEAELRLRKKIEAEQSWTSFRAEAWQLYESFPRHDMAARLLELVFLYGSAAELEEVLNSLQRDNVEFYTLVDPDIRMHLVIKLWQANRRSVLDGLLFRKDLTLRLLPLERLFCCWSLVKANEGPQAFKYFKRFDQEIWNAQKLYGSQIKQREAELALCLGRLALQADEEPLAIKLLESIPRASEEFQAALDILLDLRVERDDNGLCGYGRSLQKELDWRGRLALLDSFLLRIQRYEASAPKDRAALNELLKDPLKWFPDSPEAWQGLAEVLLQYQAIEYLLPNILNLFMQRAVLFNRPSLDHAVWSEVKKHDFGEDIRNWFWKSIAQVHEFTWSFGQKEELLWDARRQYKEAREHAGKDLLISWQQLHRSLLQWIHKMDRVDEVQRQRLLVLTKLLGDTQDISEADICTYLAHVAHPSQEVMKALEDLARDRQQWGLESFILDRKAIMLHYTNEDLARLWQLAVKLKRHDQAWRVASVLRSRQVLNEALDRHWSICGEKKREFSVHKLSSKQISKIVTSFEADDRRLAEALLSVGPLIPELLSILNQHLVPLKKGRSKSEAEIEIQKVLDEMEDITHPKKILSSRLNGMWQSKPPFFSCLLETKWSQVFMCLAQQLGIPTWDWQLSLLHHQIENIVPKMTRGSELPMSGKVGRWLRALSPQQRKAWYELAQLAKRFDDEQAQLLMARLLAKITTVMLPDHPLALASLEKLRAPLRLRWDLEHWIVSDAYGDIRRSLGTLTIGQYPDDVYVLNPLATSP